MREKNETYYNELFMSIVLALWLNKIIDGENKN